MGYETPKLSWIGFSMKPESSEKIKDVLVTNSIIMGNYFFAQIREGNQLVIWDRGLTPKQLGSIYDSLQILIKNRDKGR